MSLLAEVLSAVETTEISELGERVPVLQVKLDILKKKLVDYKHNVYEKYATLGYPQQCKKLLSSAEELREEILKHKKNVENIKTKKPCKTNKKLHEDITKLIEQDYTLKKVVNYLKIITYMEEFTLLLQDNQFHNCMKIQTEVTKMVKDIEDEEMFGPFNLKKILYENHLSLMKSVKKCFNDKVVLFKDENLATIKIYDSQHLELALMALYCESNFSFLSEFKIFLWKNFFVSILENTVEIEVEKNTNCSIIKRILRSNKRGSYENIFSHLQTVFDFLLNNFNFSLTEDCKITTFDHIRNNRDALSKLIINQCLIPSIPSTAEDLDNYKVIKEHVDKFELFLKDIKVFASDSTPLSHFVNNIDFYFINKQCKEHKLYAEKLMKTPLSNCIQVGKPFDSNDCSFSELECFPLCMVSKSASDLIQYCMLILKQAKNNSNEAAKGLEINCHSILSSYAVFVPEYFSEHLKTIPQQAALFHNNCFYIAHKMTLNYGLINGETLIVTLKNAGDNVFKMFVKEIINKQMNILKDGITEKSVRQCLKEQEYLKTEWHNVLPAKIYNKTQGIILNSLCKSLIDYVFGLNKISTLFSKELVNIIKMIFEKGPNLFTDTAEINLFVDLWCKLNELNFVLTASLEQITERWGNGGGPLGIQFKSNELICILRALFENSEKLSALLNKI